MHTPSCSLCIGATADTFFTIVDLHAITMPHEPRELLEASRRTAALYLAAGIDPSRASIFLQSHVPAHSELAWLLQCYTPVGWLRKMIQFKEKSRKQARRPSGGAKTRGVLHCRTSTKSESECGLC